MAENEHMLSPWLHETSLLIKALFKMPSHIKYSDQYCQTPVSYQDSTHMWRMHCFGLHKWANQRKDHHTENVESVNQSEKKRITHETMVEQMKGGGGRGGGRFLIKMSKWIEHLQIDTCKCTVTKDSINDTIMSPITAAHLHGRGKWVASFKFS